MVTNNKDNDSLLNNEIEIYKNNIYSDNFKENEETSYQNFREDKIECKHLNFARLFFFLGLIFYIPLIYSIQYINEPNKHIRRYAKASILPFIIYPSFLILITISTD